MGEESESRDASEPRDASASRDRDDGADGAVDAPTDADEDSGGSDSFDWVGESDDADVDDVAGSEADDADVDDAAGSEADDADADDAAGSEADTAADDAAAADRTEDGSVPSADAGYDPTEFDFDDPDHYSHWIDEVDEEKLEHATHSRPSELRDEEETAADEPVEGDDEADVDAAADEPVEGDDEADVDAVADGLAEGDNAAGKTATSASTDSSDAAAFPESGEGTSASMSEPATGATEEAAAVSNTPTTATTDGATTEYSPVDSFADEEMLDGPESDVEMPLADHIEEMVRRTAVVLVVAGVVTAFVFPIADDLVNFLWNTHIPGAATIEDRRPRLYGPLELILTELKVAGLAGFVIGLPVFVYETYRFMRPGLYPKERRYYLAAVPTSLILALVGVAFAHFVVLPAIFAYFTAYTEGTAVIAFGLRETFGLILILMGYMALVFQIPLFIMLAIMMGLVTRQWLTEKRLLFWGGFLGVSFLVSPDPTGMAPIIIAATMIALFEGTLLLLRWTGR